ncbi:MAG: hypothetical protein LH606_08105 [Cytophagaceae bacterium]|nr:hypothetical protein [Cytophagaceae bacterium]
MKLFIALSALLTLLTKPPANGQNEYQGTWLNTDAYSQDVTQLKVYVHAGLNPTVYVSRGNPRHPRHREVYDATMQRRSVNEVPGLAIRMGTPDEAETYQVNRQPEARLRVIRHTGFPAQTDTIWFRRENPLRRKCRVDRLAEAPTTREFLLTFISTVIIPSSLFLLTYNPQIKP